MKFQMLFENDRIKAMFDKRYSKMRDSLSRKDIAFLSGLVKRKKAKKALPPVPDESMDKFLALKLVNDKGQPNLAAIEPFMTWLIANPSREMDYLDKRADADDSLTRGHLKRDNDWVDPKQKRARKVVKNLNDQEKRAFEKLYNRYMRKQTRNLAQSWGDVKATDLIALQKLGILDDDANLTEFGEFAVKYYMAFKDDPDGLDRVSKDQRVGNYGTARKRRQNRLRRILNK